MVHFTNVCATYYAIGNLYWYSLKFININIRSIQFQSQPKHVLKSTNDDRNWFRVGTSMMDTNMNTFSSEQTQNTFLGSGSLIPHTGVSGSRCESGCNI